MPTITSIVVTYHPKSDELAPLLERLLLQTDRVILVDNTPGHENPGLAALCLESSAPKRCVTIRFGENLGIAKALNEGCERAKSLGTEFVLLSDQDSLPNTDMVAKLIECYQACAQQYGNVAAVGPTYTDIHTELTYPFQIQKPGDIFYSHAVADESQPYLETFSLITSGTLVPMSALLQVGPMREDLFIDQVDIEWGMRARHLGFRLMGCGSARMYQRMGENSVRVWYFGWRNESLYSPLRLYYRLRNFVALLKDPKISWRWKVRSSWYSLGLVYTHIVFAPQRYTSAIFAIKGLYDGIRGRMGRLRGTSLLENISTLGGQSNISRKN
ncbi:glycosyltransferase family 2 protein [Kineobactrum salinum]|uniref:Glycosyltransferase family 2 protein n=1 Tax=Kineobactrum salinum TaxID=2708301 RepID=A0A6C0U259_9GAMM|nr:glycosyltransferase family 2 protein [Kineobactrum salinum]QIB66161.1 glycosyltransferase family 2 protein [Kineobactrum salinum]